MRATARVVLVRPLRRIARTALREGRPQPQRLTGTPASNETAGQADGTNNNTTSSAYRTARASASVVSERAGQGIEQATQFVRDQPAFTLVLTGFLCLMLGILLGRR